MMSAADNKDAVSGIALPIMPSALWEFAGAELLLFEQAERDNAVIATITSTLGKFLNAV